MRRVAIVTGGARGIGMATVRALASADHDVAVIDLAESATAEAVDAARSVGVRAVGIGADVSEAAAVEHACARVVAELAAPTVLVNNAGIIRDDLLFRMSDADFDDVLRVHVRGAFLMTRAVQAHQVRAGWGRIINLSSTSALGNRGQTNYSAAKAALQGMTKTHALELGRFGITCNAVAPGFIRTDMFAQTATRLGVTEAELEARIAARIPAGRVGTPGDVADVIAFLASDAASYVNGQVLYVSGGPPRTGNALAASVGDGDDHHSQ